ncbi:MAG: hypothetical protein QOH88_975 [Verrucomicrobiota bacterium]|jgi:hypothetical protein
MFLLKQILPAAIAAMMVAGGVCGLALFWGKERARGVLAPGAIGLAYVAGHFWIAGWAKFPPADTTNWLPYFALAAAIVGAACSRIASLPGWARLLLFALLSAGALRILLKPKFQYGWSPGEGWLWVTGLTGALVLLLLILDVLARRSEIAFEVPLFLLVISAGTFGALMLSGSMLLGQFASVLAAAVFGSLLFAARKVELGGGVGPVFCLLLGALLVSGYFFASLPAVSGVLLGFAPVLALTPIGKPGKLLAFGIRATLVSVTVIVALAAAFRASPPLDY